MKLSIFPCAFQPSACLLWRKVCLDPPPLFDWVVCGFSLFLFDTELLELFYILEINPLLVTLQIMSPILWGYLFVYAFLCLRRLLSLIRPHLFTSVFVFITVEVKSKLLSRVRLCDPMYSPWNSLGQNAGMGSLSLLQGNLPNPRTEPRSPSSHLLRIFPPLIVIHTVKALA